MKIAEPHPTFVAPPERQPSHRFALFNLGFRPLYLGGAACATVALTLWLLVLSGVPLSGGYLMKLNPVAWHAHEMVFGFAAAVIAGFLLTAVRAWTGMMTARGLTLALVVATWLVARVLVWSGPAVPAAVIDSLFLPAVALLLLRTLHRAGNRRNYFLVPVLLLFGLLNALFHYFMLSGEADFALRCVMASVGIIVLLVSVITGRVVPMFTTNAIPGFVSRRWRPVELAVPPVTLLALLADAAQAGPFVVAPLAALACAIHVARLVAWRSYAVRRPPILLILHLAYAWIPVGFALLVLSAFGDVPHTLAMHAFTAGVIGGAIISMITRTARGHTGKPLTADRRDIASYTLVMAGSALRVFGPLVAPRFFLFWITAAGLCWIVGFGLYVIAYALPLCRPRQDGKPG
ncbi:NnrS family protein [Paraburkholderia sartisoli]|uniref:Uncharacterized protein involved in response to NO n=1 Tax=Paraburkholderia sartisoli TaxID=83784 RepID=A0A1H4A4E0_9BURK|nr:NnrS family protein [Paraburkholderia sartisoli]SEA30826.1 uncharacterized protein involved in response to NO [Paraburkholderia sartisoli]